MYNNREKKMKQEEKRVDLKDEMVLEMVKGGEVVKRDDGTFYCTRCRKTVRSQDHRCPKKTGPKIHDI